MQDIIQTKYKRYIDDKRLILTGNLPPKKVASYLAKAKVVVVPSLFDNFPYTVLEALSIGKLVVASRQGGQTEMIEHGQNGFLFDHYKEGDFHHQLQNALSLSEEKVAELSAQSKSIVATRFSPEVIYKQKVEALKVLVASEANHKEYPFIQPIATLINEKEQPLSYTDKLLSVVIPYYNMGEYVEETIKSVLAADYPHKEIIIIDDGSTDRHSVSKLKKLNDKYPIRVLSKPNSGLSDTRNYGASVAQGEFIAFLDSDDTVEPSYYSRAVSILERYQNIHFVGCWLKYFGEGDGVWPTFNPEPPYLLIHNTINSSAVVLKRKTFVNYGLNCTDLIYGMEDWESVIKMVGHGYRGVVIPEALFNYRVRKGSMSQQFTREKQLYLTRLIGHKHKSFYADFGGEIAQLLNSNGPSLYFDNPTFEVVQMMPSKRMASLKNVLKEYIKRSKTLRRTVYFIYRKLKHI